MSIINTFLQKIKLRENNHGVFMVAMAYTMSFVMLVLGSDVFYNMRSKAADISNHIMNEEIEESNNPEDTVWDNYLKASNTKVLDNDLINPYGLEDTYEDQAFEEAAEQALSRATKLTANQSDIAAQAEEIKTQSTTKADQEEKAKDKSEDMSEDKSKDKTTQTLAVTRDVTLPFTITKEEVGMLERIVEAEAGGEDKIGKILVANVIFNRVMDDEFPDSVKKVIFHKVNDKYQFSPLSDNRFWEVEVSKETKEAVKQALEGEDYSDGALYFISRKRTKKSRARWFDDNLKWLFKHGGHEFFR